METPLERVPRARGLLCSRRPRRRRSRVNRPINEQCQPSIGPSYLPSPWPAESARHPAGPMPFRSRLPAAAPNETTFHNTPAAQGHGSYCCQCARPRPGLTPIDPLPSCRIADVGFAHAHAQFGMIIRDRESRLEVSGRALDPILKEPDRRIGAADSYGARQDCRTQNVQLWMCKLPGTVYRADPGRLLDLLTTRSAATPNHAGNDLPFTRQAVSKHMAVPLMQERLPSDGIRESITPSGPSGLGAAGGRRPHRPRCCKRSMPPRAAG